jgi:formamidopyrimidine-DNA glycosylase
MPELPEVETIRLGLKSKIVGKKIKRVEVHFPKLFIGEPKDVEGKKILKIWRKAKVLGWDLEKGKSLLFHLKMTGQLIYVEGDSRLIGGHPTSDMRDQMPNKTSHNIFYFSDGSILYFNDQRKFGWVRVMDTNSLSELKLLKSLGPEPLEKGFTWQSLKQNLLRHKSMNIKTAILDQSVVSGIGNIYSSEACFEAKLDPRTKVSELSDAQFKRLHQGIIKALKAGIKYGGSSMTHFVNEEGRKGYFLDHAFVYWRDGAACKVCGTEIKKVQLNGRGTYFCPRCQK